jgi:hypothetical protein
MPRRLVTRSSRPHTRSERMDTHSLEIGMRIGARKHGGLLIELPTRSDAERHRRHQVGLARHSARLRDAASVRAAREISESVEAIQSLPGSHRAVHARTKYVRRSQNTIALSASGPVCSLGARWSTATTVPGETRDAGSRQRWPLTVTRPSVHSRRARDHATPVCWRTTAATVGAGEFTSNACCAARTCGVRVFTTAARKVCGWSADSAR